MLNSVKDKRERIGRMLQMHANDREDIKEARAGDIVALAGLKNTTTGDTLCDPASPVVLERMDFPDPVIEIAVEPKTKADQEKLGQALARLAHRGSVVPRLGRSARPARPIIKGMGELHLEIIVDRMRASSRSRPMSARRRSPIARPSRGNGRRSSTPTRSRPAARASSARVKMQFEPLEPGAGLRVRERGRRRHRAEGIHPGRREGPRAARWTTACSPASR